MGNDFSNEEQSITGKFSAEGTLNHPLFGNITLMRLQQRPSKNPVLASCSPYQQFMSLSTSINHLVLGQLHQSLQKIQKESQSKMTPFIRIFQIGGKSNSNEQQYGFTRLTTEYFERTLSTICEQRKNLNKYFSEAEMWYTLGTLSKASLQLIETPYCEFIPKTIPLYSSNIFIDDEGHIRLSSHLIYLAKPKRYQVEQQFISLGSDYKDLMMLVQVNLQKERERNSNFCGSVDDSKAVAKNSLIDPAFMNLSRAAAKQIGLILISMGAMNPDQMNLKEEDVRIWGQRYSQELNILVDSLVKKGQVQDLSQLLMYTNPYEKTDRLELDLRKCPNIEVKQFNMEPSLRRTSHQQQSQDQQQSFPQYQSQPQPPQQAPIQQQPKHVFVEQGIQTDVVKQATKQIQIEVPEPPKEIQYQQPYYPPPPPPEPQPHIIYVHHVPTQESYSQQSQTHRSYSPKPFTEQKYNSRVDPQQYKAHKSSEMSHQSRASRLYTPDVTIDERVRVALNQSRQILANQNLTYFSISQPTREYFTPKDNGLHFNLVPALNEDFEGKFWRVIKEAKLQVLQSERSQFPSGNNSAYLN